MENIIQFLLSATDAVNPDLLVAVEDRDLGSEPEIKQEQIAIYLGNRPISVNLFDTYQMQKKTLPANLTMFDEYDVWLITYTVGIIKHGGWKKVRKIGLEINYPDKRTDPRITIQSCIPNTEFRSVANGKAKFKAGLTIDGHLKAMLDDIKVEEFVELGANAKMNLGADLHGDVNLEYSILSAKVVAIGEGNTHGQWEITRDNEPLLGTQSFSHTILTPKGLTKLKVKARVSADITGPIGNSTVKLNGKWTRLDAISTLFKSKLVT